MNRCKIVEEVKYRGATYYRVLGSDTNEYVFKKYGETDFVIVDYNKYIILFNKGFKNNAPAKQKGLR